MISRDQRLVAMMGEVRTTNRSPVLPLVRVDDVEQLLFQDFILERG